MSEPAEQLLEAEKAVQELLTSLQDLKREVQGYANARQALNRAGEDMGSLATRFSALAEKASGVIDTLRSVGTPGIIAKIESAQKDIRDLRNEVTGIGRTASTSKDTIDSVGKSVDRISQHLDAATKLIVSKMNRKASLLTVLVVIAILLSAASIVVSVLKL